MKFKTLLIDPPWRYKSPGWLGGAERHYETVSNEDLMRLPVSEIAEKDAHLWLWCTDHHLTEVAPQLIEHWGFTKRGIWPWIKLSGKAHADVPDPNGTYVFKDGYYYKLAYGNGYYGRSTVEYLLLATRGKTQVNNARHGRKIVVSPQTDFGALHPEPWAAPLGEHSAKPQEAYDLIVEYSSGPRLELFAREAHGGFCGWGDQYPFESFSHAELNAWRASISNTKSVV